MNVCIVSLHSQKTVMDSRMKTQRNILKSDDQIEIGNKLFLHVQGLGVMRMSFQYMLANVTYNTGCP